MSSTSGRIASLGQQRLLVGIVLLVVFYFLFGPVYGSAITSLVLGFIFFHDMMSQVSLFAKDICDYVFGQARELVNWMRGDQSAICLFMEGCLQHKVGISLQLKQIYQSQSRVELFERCGVLLSLFNLEQVSVSLILKSLVGSTRNVFQSGREISPQLIKRLGLLTVATDMMGVTNFKSGNAITGYARAIRDSETTAKELISILQELGLVADPVSELFQSLNKELDTLKAELDWIRDVSDNNQSSLAKEENRVRYQRCKDLLESLLQRVTLQKTTQYGNNAFVLLFTQLSQVKNQSLTMFKEIDAMLASMSNRPTPVGVCLVGASRIGKSYFAECLTRLVGIHLQNRALEDESLRPAFGNAKNFQTWCANTRDEYDEGYFGQEFHYIDDAFQQKDHADHLPLINFISNNPIGTVQAKIDAKGRPYRTYMVLCSSNSVPVKSSTVECLPALHERFPITIRCKAVEGVVKDPTDFEFKHLRMFLTDMKTAASAQSDAREVGISITAPEVARVVAERIIAQYRIFSSATDFYQNLEAHALNYYQSDVSRQMELFRFARQQNGFPRELDHLFGSLYVDEQVETVQGVDGVENVTISVKGETPFSVFGYSSYFDIFTKMSNMKTASRNLEIPDRCVLVDPLTTEKWLFGKTIQNGEIMVRVPDEELTHEQLSTILLDGCIFSFENTGLVVRRVVLPKYEELLYHDFTKFKGTTLYSDPLVPRSRFTRGRELVHRSFVTLKKFLSPLDSVVGQLAIVAAPILGLDVCQTVTVFLKEHKKLVSGIVVGAVVGTAAVVIYKMLSVDKEEVECKCHSSAPLCPPARKKIVRNKAETSGPVVGKPRRKITRAETSGRDLKPKEKQKPRVPARFQKVLEQPKFESDIDIFRTQAFGLEGNLYENFDDAHVEHSMSDIVAKDIFVALQSVSESIAAHHYKTYFIVGGCGVESPSQMRDLFVSEGEVVVNSKLHDVEDFWVFGADYAYVPRQFCRHPTLVFSLGVRAHIDLHHQEILDILEKFVPNFSSLGVIGYIHGDGSVMMRFIVLSRESLGTDVLLGDDDKPSKELVADFEKKYGVTVKLSPFNRAQSSDDSAIALCRRFYEKNSVIVWADSSRSVSRLFDGKVAGIRRVYHGVGCENYILTLNHGSAGVGTYQAFTRQKGQKSDGLLFQNQKDLIIGICTGCDITRDVSVYRILTLKEIEERTAHFEWLKPMLDKNPTFDRKLKDQMMSNDVIEKILSQPRDVIFMCPTQGVMVMGKCERRLYNVYTENQDKPYNGLMISNSQGQVIEMDGIQTTTAIISAPTQAGDCGGTYFLMDPSITKKFVGLHHAGNYVNNQAMSTVIPLDLFESLKIMPNANRLQASDPFGFEFDGRGALRVPPVRLAHPSVDLFSSFVDKNASGVNVPAGEHVRSYGKFLLPHRAEGRGSTCYKHKSPFFGCFPIVREPPPFSPLDPRITAALPLDANGNPSLTLRANNALGEKAPPLNQEVLNDCVQQLSKWFAINMADKCIGILPQEDVLDLGMNGRTTNRFVRHMRVGKSSGLPHSALGSPKKSDFIELKKNGRYGFRNDSKSQTFMKFCRDKLERSAHLERVTSFIGCSLKDQPIPQKHIAAGKVRVFYPVPLENFLIGRGLFGSFWEAMSADPILFRNSIGINELSMDWKNLYEELSKKKNVLDLDFKEWDKHLPSELLFGAYMIAILAIQLATDDGYHNHRWVHAYEMVRSILVDGNAAFVKEHANPSGSPDTTHINGLAALLALFYIYSLIVGYVDLEEFLEVIYSSHNGDDVTIGVDDRVKDIFNYPVLIEYFKRLGMIATPGMKGEFVEGQLFTTLHEMTFLKRRFVVFEDMVFCPIEEASVFSRFGYTRNTVSDLEEIKGTIHAALDEWVMMGKDVYEENVGTLLKRTMERSFPTAVREAVSPLLVFTYEQHLAYIRYLFHSNVHRYELDLQRDRVVYKPPILFQGGIAEEISASGGTLYDVLNEEGVPTLRSDLDRVQSDVQFLAQRVESLEGRVNVLNSRVIDLSEGVENLTVAVGALGQQVQLNNARVDILTSQVDSFEGRIFSVESAVVNLTTQVENLDSSLSALSSDMAALRTRTATLEEYMWFDVSSKNIQYVPLTVPGSGNNRTVQFNLVDGVTTMRGTFFRDF